MLRSSSPIAGSRFRLEFCAPTSVSQVSPLAGEGVTGDGSRSHGYQKCKAVMSYDGQGRVLTRTEAPGTPEAATESYAYDSEGRQVTRTDARGKIWTTTYASCCGHSVSSKNPLGHGSVSNKDNGGLVTHTAGIGDVDSHTTLLDPIDAKTLRETTTRYDALGRSIAACTWLVPQGIIDSENPPMAGFDGISGQDGLTSQTLYDADLTDGIGLDSTAGVTVTNPLGGTFTVSLSAALTKMAEPIAQGGANTTFNADATGSAVVNMNAENEVSFSISDAQGRTIISGIQHPRDPLPGNTQGDLLTWSCHVTQAASLSSSSSIVLATKAIDALGHITTSHTNALGHTLETIDQLNFASTVKYDAAGNPIETRDPNNTGYDMAYDDLNRNTSRTDMVGSQAQSVYDRFGLQIQAIDAKGKASTSVFDARDNRITKIDRLGNATNWSYDEAGNLMSLTDAENQTTSYTYDDAGQKLTETYPDHVTGSAIGTISVGMVTFSFDGVGRTTARTDQMGDTVSSVYDLVGRLTSRDYRSAASSLSGPIADSDVFTYDEAGRILSAVSGRYSNTIAHIYDDAGRKTSESLAIGGETYTIATAYDSAGHIDGYIDPNGDTVARTYTGRGQLSTIGYNGTAVDTRTYDEGGRLLSSTYNNGVSQARIYNPDNTLASISHAGAAIGDYTYGWDNHKNKTSEGISGTMSGYGFTVPTGGYDSEDRLTAWNRADTNLNQSWNLTAVGDWTSITENGTTQSRTHGPTHELLTAAGQSVTHDVKGNTTSIPAALRPSGSSALTLNWDQDNRMSSATDGTTTVTYQFDALGRRVSRNDGTTTTVFVQNGQQTFADYTLGTAAASPNYTYTFASYIDEPVLRTGTGDWRYFHRNQQYSVTALTDPLGSIKERYAYSAYGTQSFFDGGGATITSSAENNRYTYTGREWDEMLKLYHYRARMYDSISGRFCSRDPIGFEGSRWSLYEFVGSMPLRFLDPSGLSWGSGKKSKGNCWRFACNDPRKPGEPHSPFPGNKDTGGVLTCKQLMDGAKKNGAKPSGKGKTCPKGHCPILGVLTPRKGGFNDFHWYRKCHGDPGWGHKPGSTPVQPPVVEPEKDTKRREYTLICGYLCVKEKGHDCDKNP